MDKGGKIALICLLVCILLSVVAVVVGACTSWYGLASSGGTSATSGGTSAVPTTAPMSGAPTSGASTSGVPVTSYVNVPFLDVNGGTDTNISQSAIGSLGTCQTLCSNTTGCNGLEYDSQSQTCWLKSNLTNSGIVLSTSSKGLSYPSTANILPPSLTSPATLPSGAALVSPGALYAALMQSDGNLVVYDLKTGSSTWASNTAGSGRVSCAMQSDGNCVLYNSASKAIWASNGSNTRATDTYKLSMQDDGNLVVYTSAGTPVWACRSTATLFSDCGYAGKSTTVQPGNYATMPNGFPNDALSSIRVTGPVTVVLYADTNFGGKSFNVTSDSSCLTGFNDVTSSLKVLGAL